MAQLWMMTIAVGEQPNDYAPYNWEMLKEYENNYVPKRALYRMLDMNDCHVWTIG